MSCFLEHGGYHCQMVYSTHTKFSQKAQHHLLELPVLHTPNLKVSKLVAEEEVVYPVINMNRSADCGVEVLVPLTIQIPNSYEIRLVSKYYSLVDSGTTTVVSSI